MKFLCK